ncbi:RraA family protein [Sporosarcina ureilytica]|uniref:Putative 4-hydroxy-4-methyl-2-oxoglutarate aldolase n=1 Tax=Sporosarcina ureilytica TaxID=298596 RepID=A0A1D8JC33_9BACL|nr:RraA family protein [Sporosarcina ureilytica]AOV06266.1 regulator [Sporosarcina ureilytica]
MTINYIEEYSKLPTTCISDALKGENAMDISIKPLANYKVAGRAYTVKIPKGQNKELLRAIKEASKDDVLVIDAEEDTSKAIAGDFVLGMAKTLGIKGVVTNGVIRDIEDIINLDFPVFCKGTTISAGSKSDGGYSEVPISCGGVVVNHGDIIVGDRDGVIVVPKEIEAEVLEKAKKKLQRDEERENKVSNNIDAIHKYIDTILQK